MGEMCMRYSGGRDEKGGTSCGGDVQEVQWLNR